MKVGCEFANNCLALVAILAGSAVFAFFGLAVPWSGLTYLIDVVEVSA